MLKRLCVFLSIIWILAVSIIIAILHLEMTTQNFGIFLAIAATPVALIWGLYWVIVGNSDTNQNIEKRQVGI